MKTEMKMLDNSNYESVICTIQHECHSNDHVWRCREYGWNMGRLLLQIDDGDPYEDGYSNEIEVKHCPFCGYQPERSKREDSLISNVKSRVSVNRMQDLLDRYEMRCSEHGGNIVREVQ